MWPDDFWPSDGGSVPVGTAETCVLYMLISNTSGEPLEAVTGVLIIEEVPEQSGGEWIAGSVLSVTSDSDGLLDFPPVVRGARVLIRVNDVGYLKEVTVPNAATLQL